MLKYFYYKIVYSVLYLLVLIKRRWKNKQDINSDISEFFVKYNNKRILKELKSKNISADRVVIMLPHCIQNYDCPFKVTSEIDNCRMCGKCKIENFLKIKIKYGIKVKIATGGTLARLYLKENRPKVVLAVACERDLVSGIYDAFPLRVFGIFNDRINGPCVNTDVSIEEIENTLGSLNITGEEKNT